MFLFYNNLFVFFVSADSLSSLSKSDQISFLAFLKSYRLIIYLFSKFSYLLKKKNSVGEYQHYIYIKKKISLSQLKKLLYFLLLIK